MSEETLNAAPEMSDETYEMIQQLFQLVRTDDAAQMQKLFEKGFDAPNIRDGKGNTLLMLASYRRSTRNDARFARKWRGSAHCQRYGTNSARGRGFQR